MPRRKALINPNWQKIQKEIQINLLSKKPKKQKKNPKESHELKNYICKG